MEYLLEVVDATRSAPGIQVGVSTRGALSYYRGCQALAIAEGRSYVTPDDIKSLAVGVLSHRVVAESVLGVAGRQKMETHIRTLVDQIPVPM